MLSRRVLVDAGLGEAAHHVVDGADDVRHLFLRDATVVVDVVQVEDPLQLLSEGASREEGQADDKLLQTHSSQYEIPPALQPLVVYRTTSTCTSCQSNLFDVNSQEIGLWRVKLQCQLPHNAAVTRVDELHQRRELRSASDEVSPSGTIEVSSLQIKGDGENTHFHY